MDQRRLTRRQFCQVGLGSLASLSLLAACGEGSGGANAETLQLSFWGDASRNKLTRNAIKLYHDQHSSITINSWFADFNSYFDKLNTQISGGSTPDLIQMDMAYVKRYVEQHTLLDLTSLIANKTIDMSDFDQDMLKNSEDNGVVYGIPLGGNYECLFYNSAQVKQSNVGDPPANMTWSDFASYTTQLSKALASKNVVGVSDSSGAIDIFEIWVRQHGTELYTPDGKLAFQADVVESWFSYWNDLRKAGGCASAQLQATVTGSGPSLSLLGQSKAVFAPAHSNQLGAFQATTKDTLLMLAPPTGPKPGLYLKPSMLMSIAANSKYTKDAADFINFIITQPAGVKAIGLDRGVPGSARARNALSSVLKPTDKIVLAYQDQIASGNQRTPKTVLDPAGASKLQTTLLNVSQSVGFGKMSVKAGAASFYQQAQQALA